MILNIITVGYNEENNLPKYFKNIENFEGLCKIRSIYCDQGSTDSSYNIAIKYKAEIYQHGKKGYCERSRKRAVDNLVEQGEWALILDCDEEVSLELAKEISSIINKNAYGVVKIMNQIVAFGMPVGIDFAIRLFRKGSVNVTDTIHEYIKLTNENFFTLKNKLHNKDLKESEGNEVFNWINKVNIYTQTHRYNDYVKYDKKPLIYICFMMRKDIFIRFLYFYFRMRLIRYGWRGFYYSLLQCTYPIILFAKIFYLAEKEENA